MTKRSIVVSSVLGLLLAAGASLATQQPAGQATALWTLKGTRVVDAGQTVEIPADPESGLPGGVLVSGFTLEARARSKGALLPDGVFRLTLSAFKPAGPLPGQDPAFWDVRGDWTIVDKHAPSEALRSRHNPYTLAGKLHASLPFNPAGEERNWSAQATVPLSPAAGAWRRGSLGTLSLDAAREGDLLLVLTFLPNGEMRRLP